MSKDSDFIIGLNPKVAQAMGKKPKPKCKLIGEDGNVFNLAGIVTGTLKKAGMKAEAEEFSKRLWEMPSYDAALNLMGEYVEIY